jgi:hypothetical protein
MDIITRAEARAQGLTHYFTGVPCKHGHIAQRRVDRPECGECYRIRSSTPAPIAPPRACAHCGCDFVPAINRASVVFCSAGCRQVAARTPEKRARERELYAQNREHVTARKRAAYQADLSAARVRAKAYYEANRESERARAQRFFEANPTYRRDYERRRYQEDEQWRIRKILRARLFAIVKRGMGKKLGSTLELLGCTLEEFQAHIEAQWVDGMNWDNLGHVGDVWHIDHIKPCASFDLTDPAQQKACFHWSNLQPLWAADNQRKGAKLVA